MKYKVNKGFVVQKFGKELAIFDGEKSALFTFNQTATFIFQKLKVGLNIIDITDSIAKTYKISLLQASKDVENFIEKLLFYKIITKV